MNHTRFETWLKNPSRKVLIMGVLNITPDSFSDGGLYLDPARAVDRGLEMVAEGADLLDIGGESTRPGSEPVPPQEQISRVVPVIGRLRAESEVVISIDTTRASVAQAALEAGANLINDISAGRDDPAMLFLAGQSRAPIILMHMQGTPRTMQDNPRYVDVTVEVIQFLQKRMEEAQAAGVEAHRVLLDPGIGFGKTVEHNLTLLRQLSRFTELGKPVVVGVSRKRFIGTVTDRADPRDRLFGTAAAVAWCVANGAGVVRVHDVREMRDVVRMVEGIVGSYNGSSR